jgi:hypothetical protein
MSTHLQSGGGSRELLNYSCSAKTETKCRWVGYEWAHKTIIVQL